MVNLDIYEVARFKRSVIDFTKSFGRAEIEATVGVEDFGFSFPLRIRKVPPKEVDGNIKAWFLQERLCFVIVAEMAIYMRT